MADKQTIGISSLITLAIVLASTIGPTYFENQKFYCEAESSIMECLGGLSGGAETRCYLNIEKTRWDYCKSGWIEVTDDREIQEEPSSGDSESGVWGKSYLVKSGQKPVLIN